MIFVDTSAFLALVNDKDKNHIAAKELLEGIKKGKIRIKKLSFTDCTSFALMKKKSIEKAFFFDEDFKRPGFLLLP